MDETPGDELRRRRERLGFGDLPFAERAHLDRATVKRVETGRARGTSVAKYMTALEELEGMTKPHSLEATASEGDSIEIEVTGDFGVRTGNFGVRIVARSSVEHIEQLREALSHLVVTINGDHPHSA